MGVVGSDDPSISYFLRRNSWHIDVIMKPLLSNSPSLVSFSSIPQGTYVDKYKGWCSRDECGVFCYIRKEKETCGQSEHCQIGPACGGLKHAADAVPIQVESLVAPVVLETELESVVPIMHRHQNNFEDAKPGSYSTKTTSGSEATQRDMLQPKPDKRNATVDILKWLKPGR